jgi:hypothetical protein
VDRVQEWYSVTTLAEYLLGYGNHNQDGYGVIDPTNPNDTYTQERPRLGIRHPGRDGVWGATINQTADGSLDARMRGQSASVDVGKVYGPYLELKDERMLAAATYDDDGEVELTFPGTGGYDAAMPKVLVDYWGNPIRYYRRLYAPGDLRSPYRTINLSGTLPEPTLSDVFVLRPFEVDPGGAIDSVHADDAGDSTTTTALNSAEFALFSAGADRNSDATARYDGDEFNKDNIVELGP